MIYLSQPEPATALHRYHPGTGKDRDPACARADACTHATQRQPSYRTTAHRVAPALWNACQQQTCQASGPTWAGLRPHWVPGCCTACRTTRAGSCSCAQGRCSSCSPGWRAAESPWLPQPARPSTCRGGCVCPGLPACLHLVVPTPSSAAGYAAHSHLSHATACLQVCPRHRTALPWTVEGPRVAVQIP